MLFRSDVRRLRRSLIGKWIIILQEGIYARVRGEGVCVEEIGD